MVEVKVEAGCEGVAEASDAGLVLLLPFIQRQIPDDPALRVYSLLLAAGFRTGNMKTAISRDVIDLLGLGAIGPKKVYDALESLGRSIGDGPIVLPGTAEASIVAVDIHVPEKFGCQLGERYNAMRGRATRTIPTLTVADVSSRGADPLLVEVLQKAAERGPPLLSRLLPRLSRLGPDTLLFDGEFISKENVRKASKLGVAFIGRLRAGTLIAGRLKPVMLEENVLYSLRTFDRDWGGTVTVLGFLRHGKPFFYISNMDASDVKLKKLFGMRWRLENYFRDARFIDEYPGCNPFKAKAHTYISFILGRLTGAFRSTAKTLRLLFKTVKRSSIKQGKLVVEFQPLSKRLLEKLKSYILYLRSRLRVEASLHIVPVDKNV